MSYVQWMGRSGPSKSHVYHDGRTICGARHTKTTWQRIPRITLTLEPTTPVCKRCQP